MEAPLRILRDHEWFARWCVRRVVGDAADAHLEHWDDALQVARVAIWRLAPIWLDAPRSKFSSFAVIPVCRDVRRYLWRQARHGFARVPKDRTGVDRPAHLPPRPEHAALARDDAALKRADTQTDIDTLLQSPALTPRRRAVLRLKADGLDRAAVGRRLGISVGMVDDLARRGVQALRAAMA